MGGGRDAGGQISSLGTSGTHGDPLQDFVEKKIYILFSLEQHFKLIICHHTSNA